MMHVQTEDGGTATAITHVPDGAIDAVARSTARIGLVDRDGLIATLSRRLCRDLGFDTPEDLRGLSIASLWHPTDRVAVEQAFTEALRGRTEGADIDMAYIHDDAGPAHVTFGPGQTNGAVLMTFDWSGGKSA
ncbi:PAS domain S-box protein [Jannaschia sp.]|nr:PAS domain S-box protein [Jannaschia sp.]